MLDLDNKVFELLNLQTSTLTNNMVKMANMLKTGITVKISKHQKNIFTILSLSEIKHMPCHANIIYRF